MRLAYALTVLTLPTIGVSIARLAHPNSALTTSGTALLDASFAELSARPRLGERRWDIVQFASSGAASGQQRP